MFKNKGYFIETVVYQVIWIITSSVISMIIFEGLDTIVYKIYQIINLMAYIPHILALEDTE